MRSLKNPIVILTLAALVVLGILKMNTASMVDKVRERRYTHSADLVMTVGLVWPVPSSETEQRYSHTAGAQYAVDNFIRAGRLKGICRGIRLKEIDEVSPQNDCIERPLREALSDPTLTAILGLASSVDAHRAAILASGHNVFVLTSLATWPALTKHGFDNLFRLTPDDAASARILGSFAKSRGYEKVGIIYAMLPHGNAIAPLLAEELAKRDTQVAFLHAYPPNPQPDFPDVLEVIGPMLKRYGKIDALFMIDDLSANARMIKYLRKAGVNVPILGSDTLDFPNIWRDAGKAAEGICFVSSRAAPKDDPRMSALYRRVVKPEDRKMISIDRFAHHGFVYGYETMSIYLSAVEVAGCFYPRQLGTVLRNREWDSMQGRIQFTADGDVVGRRLYINEIVRGQPNMVFSQTVGAEAK